MILIIYETAAGRTHIRQKNGLRCDAVKNVKNKNKTYLKRLINADLELQIAATNHHLSIIIDFILYELAAHTSGRETGCGAGRHNFILYDLCFLPDE